MNMSEQVIHNIICWIDNNLGKNLNGNNIAARVGYSLRHFQRMFYQQTGFTLARYIRQRRLEMAARALTETELPIEHLCLQYGYSSSQTFIRAFRQAFHCTPGKYRKERRFPGES
ncbi:transcriptional activator RamA [Escherichia coli TA206]|nr:transcriptional activator RamA [Escherichia coli TA206]MCX0792324.1 helix-turn-helix domain-containing protein [Escherichia coli]